MLDMVNLLGNVKCIQNSEQAVEYIFNYVLFTVG